MLIDLSLPIIFEKSELQTTDREEALMNMGHKGTHLDRILRTTVPLYYFKSRAIALDVSAFSQRRTMDATDLPLEHIQAGDFVLIHTGTMQRHSYGTKEYFNNFFELSWEAIDALIERKIHFIGIDTRGIRQNVEHHEADARCERSGIYVIENITNTEKLPTLSAFFIYIAIFDMGGTGIPCRVIAEIGTETN
jgi:kynurenine formamidase